MTAGASVEDLLRRAAPHRTSSAGLLALMLLTDARRPTPDARRPARTGPDGGLIPLAEQDRSLWDTAAIAEGTELIGQALATAPPGPYQLQAAIAAVHAEATSAEDTDPGRACSSSHREAARRTLSLPELRYLEARATRLD